MKIVSVVLLNNISLPALTRLIQHWHQVLVSLETLLFLSFQGQAFGPCLLLLVYQCT